MRMQHKKNMRFLVVGSGFSGAVVSRTLAENGQLVVVLEERSHVAGNCHTERDEKTNIMVHKYGPHIFHTDNEVVWNYVNKFGNFKDYINRVKTTVDGKVYTLPINLHTINQFFGMCMGPEEARLFIYNKSRKDIEIPVSFEEQAQKYVGDELYQAFLRGYTLKQWGLEPCNLPSSILKRLPVRFNYNDNYFNHKYQGIPEGGYTKIVQNILHHPNIKVHLNERYDKKTEHDFDHIIYTGPLDAWFAHELGRLGYRTLDFEKDYAIGDFQGCAVMNYGNVDVPYTRITEHKHFAPWEHHEDTIIFREYSRLAEKNDIPYYPIRLVREKALLSKYVQRAKQEKSVSFVGRLGTYRYLDMDVTIHEALHAAETILACIRRGDSIPVFFVDDL